MKKLNIGLDRYRKKAAGQHEETVQDRGHKGRGQLRGVLDEKTILHLCNQYITSEYGRVGASSIQAVKYVGTTVVVKVVNALWAQELWMRRDGLMRHVNQLCGSEVIKKIATDLR